MGENRRGLHIVVDALGLPRIGGTRRFVTSLLATIGRTDNRNTYTVYLSRPEGELSVTPNLRLRYVPIENRVLMRIWAQCAFPPGLRLSKADLFHSFKNMGIFGTPCQYRLTVFDLTHVKLAHMYPAIDRLYWQRIMPLLVHTSSGIMAISNTVANELACRYRIDRAKIRVIYPGVSDFFRTPALPAERQAVRARYGLRSRVALYVGGMGRHKNLRTLLRAFALLRNAADCQLVIVGGAHHTTSDRGLAELVKDLGLKGRVRLIGDVSDVELRALYAVSDLFVMPSLSEGFGLAMVEAMAQGCPVLGAQAGSIPEVCGDTGVLVADPMDVSEWALKMEMLLDQSQFAMTLRDQGRDRAQSFSWSKSARELVSWYEMNVH